MNPMVCYLIMRLIPRSTLLETRPIRYFPVLPFPRNMENDMNPAVPRIVQHYEKLAGYCDNHFTKMSATLPDQISCREGCAACCSLQSVCVLEAALIDRYFRDTHNNNAPSNSEKCVFLDTDNRCTIYAVRPIICRTHGGALKQTHPAGSVFVHHCELTFREMSVDRIPSELILDDDIVAENLMRLNLAFCMTVGVKEAAGERVSLVELAAGRLPRIFRIDSESGQPPKD